MAGCLPAWSASRILSFIVSFLQEIPSIGMVSLTSCTEGVASVVAMRLPVTVFTSHVQSCKDDVPLIQSWLSGCTANWAGSRDPPAKRATTNRLLKRVGFFMGVYLVGGNGLISSTVPITHSSRRPFAGYKETRAVRTSPVPRWPFVHPRRGETPTLGCKVFPYSAFLCARSSGRSLCRTPITSSFVFLEASA